MTEHHHRSHGFQIKKQAISLSHTFSPPSSLLILKPATDNATMQLSSYVPLSSLVTSVLRSQISLTPTTSTTSPLSLRPSPTTPSPISSSSPSSSSSPYYSPSTHYIVTTTSSTSFLLQIQQTYLVSGTSTSSLPNSGASIDPAIPMWKPTPVSAFAVVTGLGPGVASDGRVTDWEAFRKAER